VVLKHSIAVAVSGRAYGLGQKESGQLGISSFEENMLSPKLIPISNISFTKVSRGFNHSLLLTDN
jgi:alpha-tubulin suppressor-like RCC1 family protein